MGCCLVKSLVKAQRRGDIHPFSPVGETVDGIVTRVIDGDTVVFASKKFAESGKPMSITIRVLGIDTPELTAQDPYIKVAAHEARIEATKFFGGHRCDGVFTGANAERVSVSVKKNDKYGGRFVASLLRVSDGCDFGTHMIAKGFAQRYDGRGPKPVWTRSNVRHTSGV